MQFLQRAAIRPVPAFAVVEEPAIAEVENVLDEQGQLEGALDHGYRDLDRTQPRLATFLSEEIAARSDEVAQSLGYFLIVAVYLIFREAFPTRLAEIDEDALAAAVGSLETDEALRAEASDEVLETDDVIAMGQPAVLDFIQQHLQEALAVAGEKADLDQLDDVYRAVLVEVIALSQCVEAPPGEAAAPNGEILA
jgi:hypothetical protein